MRFKSFLIVFAMLSMAIIPSAEENGWKFLFNGENLDGWEVLGDQSWSVKENAIEVKATGSEMGWLVSEEEYSDFILKLRFKWWGGNSGIQVRSHLDGEKMIGYQANLDLGRTYATGSLLEENGRGMLEATTISAEILFKEDEWNEFVVSCIGDQTMVFVNGHKTADIHDPQGDDSGVIALQMGPGQGGHMMWDNIRVLPIEREAEWQSLFDGKTLKHWNRLGDSTWTVEDGYIRGRSKDGGYGWLVSREEFSDFHFTTQFKMSSGNSGIQFRSWVVDEMVHGFQADLAYGSDWINGHLYDQSERGVLVKPEQDFSKIIDWVDWNTYEITAIGPKVELFINGVKSIEFIDHERKKGVFAFQIHQGAEMETWWKNIRVLKLK